MANLLVIFVAGLLSSAHCIGMCGGIAAALGATPRSWSASIARQLVYGLGRVTTYAFLGAVGGFAGLYLSQFDGGLLTAQQVFSILAGVLMVVIGASVLGLLRPLRWRVLDVGVLLGPAFAQLLNARRTGGYFLVGLANGFLPCGLVYAFLARAVSTGRMAEGAMTMLAFGLGTLPAMTAVGCGSTLIGHAARRRVFQLAACLVIVAGAVTIVRGLPGSAPSCCEPGHGA